MQKEKDVIMITCIVSKGSVDVYVYVGGGGV